MRRRKKTQNILIGFALCLWMAAAGSAQAMALKGMFSPPAEKPSAPLQVQLTLEENGGGEAPNEAPEGGRVVLLVLEVRPLIDAPRFQMAFVLPEEVDALSGSLSWAGSLKEGESRQMRLRVRLPEQGLHTIQGMATLEQSEGARFTEVATLTLDAKDAKDALLGVKKSDPEKTPPKTTRDDRKVIEYPGE